MDIDIPALLSGNHAIARGAWEGGVRVAAGYPGTPSTEILEALARLAASHRNGDGRPDDGHPPGGRQGDDDTWCEWSPNEKVALEVAVGASLGGGRALATMKHVGLNVAADPLFSAAYMGVNGGLVVVTADDPGMHSSQNEQDNRLFARTARLPLLEPSTPEEARRFTRRAFELSERHDTPVLLRTTTRLSHGTGQVREEPRESVPLRPYVKDRVKNVVLPAHGRLRHRWIEEERMPALAVEAEAWVQRDEGHGGDFGIVTAGVPWLYATEAFPGVPVLKLGMTHPLPTEAILAFAEGRTILVVEELEPVLEEQLRALGVRCEPRTWPRWGELSVEALLGNGRARRARERTDPEVATDPHTRAASSGKGGSTPLPTLPVRAPALCPGCSHRGVFHGLNRQRAVVSGDIGCYTLGALPPLDAMDACLCMGASIGMGHGFTRARGDDGRPVVSVIGDSTFFHSGITGLLDVVYNGGSSTTVVMDNSTTAMTGHQDHPGTGSRLSGGPAPTVDIEGLVRSLGVDDVERVDAYDLMGTWRALDRATRTDTPSVILAKAACVLKERVSFGDGVAIDPDACTDCLACADIGCPALEQIDGRMRVDPLLCIGCTHCQQVCSDCNAGIDIPLVLELVAADRVDEALDVLLRSNPLPAVSARVCPHPCEREVNALGWPQGERRAAGYPGLLERFPRPDREDRVSVRAVERWLGDLLLERGADGLGPAEERNGSAAVVGSGPAGLSAAWTLRRAGWRVTVFESAPEPGGMLRVGIPGFRLPRPVLDGELARLRAIGVDFRCGVKVGEHVTLKELEEHFGAVVLAVGHHRARAVPLEGSDAVGDAVIPGLAFLDRFNAGLEPEIGRRVAIVGGGNTAVDCARAAVRMGAEAVIVYRRTEEEMPAIPDEVEEARGEGVRFVFQRQPVRVVAGPDGRLAEVETVAMAAGEAEADGRRRAVAVEGSESREPFDSVILAVGETADLDLLTGTDIRRNGRIETNFTGVTSCPGVFACGDAAFGHGTVTQAIATGRRAADLASRHLARHAQEVLRAPTTEVKP